MQKRWLVITAGLITALCLVVAGILGWQRVQALAHPPTPQPIDLMRIRAKNTACMAPETIVAGSYQEDPPQTVGDWLVLTDTVVCQIDKTRRQAFGYFEAENKQGQDCAGGTSMSVLPISATTTGPAAINVESMRQCPARGGQSGLTVMTGYLTGQGPATAQVLFGAGPPASAPLRGGRFVLLAPTDSGICLVRALDAAGAVLAELKLKQAGTPRLQGACP